MKPPRNGKKSGLLMEGVLPLSAMDGLQGIAPYYYEWLRHPVDDPWWGWADLRGKYGRTQAANPESVRLVR